MKKLFVMIALVSLLTGCVMDMNASKKEANRDIYMEPGNDSIGSIEPATDLPATLPSKDISSDPNQPVSSDPLTTKPGKVDYGNSSGGGGSPTNPGTPPDAPRQGIVASYEPLSFKAAIYRTNGYQEGKEYPEVIFIESKIQLDEYLEKNKGLYDFTRMDISSYDQTFFAKQSLAMIVLQESSGSISHKVEDVYINDGVMTFQVKRNIPEIGTTDMAQYHIVVSLIKSEIITSRSVVVFS